jgi:hypothetical protein
MRLQRATQTYLVCIRAEGRSKPVASQYRYVLNMFLGVIGDMDVRALTPDHIRRYMTEIPINEPRELRTQMAVLQFFTDWLRAQSQIRSQPTQQPPRRAGRLIAPRYAAVRRKMPLAL